jgi:carbon catabolite-derepressing protein kinase
MLQPNPVKRITLHEIQEHPWYMKDLPDYLQYISKQQMNTKNNQVDKEIVQQLFKLNLNIQKSFEEVCQDILNKRNTEYCGAYELMKHDKLKNECFKTAKQRKHLFDHSESSTSRRNAKQGRLNTL